MGASSSLRSWLDLTVVLVPDVISSLVQVLHIGDDGVLQASPTRSTKVLQQLLSLVSGLNLIGTFTV